MASENVAAFFDVMSFFGLVIFQDGIHFLSRPYFFRVVRTRTLNDRGLDEDDVLTLAVEYACLFNFRSDFFPLDVVGVL